MRVVSIDIDNRDATVRWPDLPDIRSGAGELMLKEREGRRNGNA
jgi:hypothetical protein